MSGAITVRRMVETDLPQVMAIDRAVGWPHTEARFSFLLDDAETQGLVAETAGMPIGFAFMGIREPVGWLGAVAVDPAHQGQGAGMALCRAADRYFREDVRCDTAILEAYLENRRAINLYDRLGFVVTGVADLCGTPAGEAPVIPESAAAVDADDGVARSVARLTEADLTFLAPLDDSYYGGWRDRDLLFWLSEGFEAARMLRVDGQPAGYCLVEAATGRLGPAAAPTLPDFLALLDAVLTALPSGEGAPTYAASLRIVNPDAAVLAALAARNLHLVPALRNVRMEKVYRRSLRQMTGYYVSARPEKG
jgi:GNAT superfamily N-acetyltransferase